MHEVLKRILLMMMIHNTTFCLACAPIKWWCLSRETRNSLSAFLYVLVFVTFCFIFLRRLCIRLRDFIQDGISCAQDRIWRTKEKRSKWTDEHMSNTNGYIKYKCAVIATRKKKIKQRQFLFLDKSNYSLKASECPEYTPKISNANE